MAVQMDRLPTMSADTMKRNPGIKKAAVAAVPEARIASKAASARSPAATARKPAVSSHVQRLRSSVGTNGGKVGSGAASVQANGTTVTVALAGVVVLVLYARGVPQKVWAAAMSGTGASSGTKSGGASSGTGAGAGTTALTYTPSNTSLSGGAAPDPAITAAEQAVTAGGAPGGGQNWLDWCLQWADQVRSKLGLSNLFGYANPNQALASGQGSGRGTGAPAGALILIQDNAVGHAGISNGNGTYTSVGIHSYPEVLPIPASARWNP